MLVIQLFQLLRQRVARKYHPLTCLVFVLHQETPALCLRNPGKSVMKRTIRVLKNEFDRIASAPSVAESL